MLYKRVFMLALVIRLLKMHLCVNFIVLRLIYLCNLATYIERVDYCCLEIKIKIKIKNLRMLKRKQNFTEDEKTYFVEYLTNYSSDGQDRFGNSLYKQLTLNVVVVLRFVCCI